jgi:putative N-acetylmannosamine-6-phosphate epimerase
MERKELKTLSLPCTVYVIGLEYRDDEDSDSYISSFFVKEVEIKERLAHDIHIISDGKRFETEYVFNEFFMTEMEANYNVMNEIQREQNILQKQVNKLNQYIAKQDCVYQQVINRINSLNQNELPF